MYHLSCCCAQRLLHKLANYEEIASTIIMDIECKSCTGLLRCLFFVFVLFLVAIVYLLTYAAYHLFFLSSEKNEFRNSRADESKSSFSCWLSIFVLTERTNRH